MARSSTSYRRGQSGNPRGRPRGAWGWKRRVLELATAEAQAWAPPTVSEELLRRALAGELRGVRAVLNALEYADDPGDGW
jgi:hypothetical protein